MVTVQIMTFHDNPAGCDAKTKSVKMDADVTMSWTFILGVQLVGFRQELGYVWENLT